MIGSGLSLYFQRKSLERGETFDFFLFDPSTMTQKKIAIRVAGKEKVSLNDRNTRRGDSKPKCGGRIWSFGWMKAAMY